MGPLCILFYCSIVVADPPPPPMAPPSDDNFGYDDNDDIYDTADQDELMGMPPPNTGNNYQSDQITEGFDEEIYDTMDSEEGNSHNLYRVTPVYCNLSFFFSCSINFISVKKNLLGLACLFNRVP